MNIVLDIRKTVEQNASYYFEKSKKAKKKLKGALSAVARAEADLANLEKARRMEEKKIEPAVQRKKEWYEKFRWFISSSGFLVIGGRDATTNEIIIKKYLDKNDLVFHTDIAGSPFVVVKSEGKDIDKKTIEEAAVFCAVFSRAWKAGRSSQEVYCINPEQVSKKTKSGEYLSKGSFMIYGERKYFSAELKLAIGTKNSMVIAGPVDAVRKHCEKFVELTHGDEKTSSAAKLIRKLAGGELDDIIRALPSGGCRVKLN
jgi:predicted ribosome quality control (RQC) complex YloA/Tae2 family protein